MSDLTLVSSLLDASLTGKLPTAAAALRPPVPAPTVSAASVGSSSSSSSSSSKKKDGSRSRSRDRHSRRSRRSRSRSRDRGSRSKRSRRSRSRSRSRSRHSRRGRRSRSRSPRKGSSSRRGKSRSRSRSSSKDKFVKTAETAEEKVIRDRIRDQCTVLVSSLPTRATTRDIATYFSQCGTIRDVRLIQDRNRVTKGFSYVEFETPDEATAALRLSGALFQGRSLTVQATQNEKNRANEAKQAMLAAAGGAAGGLASCKVYVGSLNFQVTEDAIRSIFQPFGHVTEVQLHRDPTTGTSRGFGFVTFALPHEARRAIAELNGLEVLGRPIKVGESSKGSEAMLGMGGDATANGSVGAGGGGGGEGGEDGDRLDGDDGLVLNQATRSLLMAKLQRDEAIVPHVTPANVNLPMSDLIHQAGVVMVPSRCLVLQNAFNPAEEDARPDNSGWEAEIESDVRAECESRGAVEHCKLERTSGCIYVRFADVKGAVAARQALNGRFFGGQTISVDFVSSQVYASKYGN